MEGQLICRNCNGVGHHARNCRTGIYHSDNRRQAQTGPTYEQRVRNVRPEALN